MNAPVFCTRRVTVVTGHYGTGKTEFSVNLALALAGAGERVMLADLDIVNPGFRSRERREVLEAAGIRLITTSQACADADVPAVPAELLAVLEDRGARGVLDAGGDSAGARVLARFRPQLLREDCQMVFVLNASRPEVREAAGALAYLRAVEETAGLRCTGLVNNTHLCGETTEAEIRRGAELAERVSQETGIPVLCHMAEERLVPRLPPLELREPVFPITVQMRKPWERAGRR